MRLVVAARRASARTMYLICWGVVFEVLSIWGLAAFLALRDFEVPWVAVLLLVVANALHAERLAEVGLSLCLRSHTPPALDSLHTQPRVALLYCTCDDLVSECLTLSVQQTYRNCRVFVLDDSATETYRNRIQAVGHTVIRRNTRAGFKAGNLNNWLRMYGVQYDYFVILDADSILPNDFVARMLLYGEHPRNGKVAMFESKIAPYAASTRLGRTLATNSRIANAIAERLHTRLGVVISSGHNNLCRTSQILSVDGFDERFISEDHATTLNLVRRGFGCTLVDVDSYELVPENLPDYVRRSVRWARSDVQLLRHPCTGIPLCLQIRLFLRSVAHLLWLPYIAGTLWLSCGFTSSWGDLGRFAWLAFWDPQLVHPAFWLLFSLSSAYMMSSFFCYLPAAGAVGVHASQYLSCAWYTACLGWATAVPVAWGVLKTCLCDALDFQPTVKNRGIVSSSECMRALLPGIVSGFIVCLGVLRNPFLLVLNWAWVFTLAATPFVLYETVHAPTVNQRGEQRAEGDAVNRAP